MACWTGGMLATACGAAGAHPLPQPSPRLLQILGTHNRKPNAHRRGCPALWRALCTLGPSRLHPRAVVDQGGLVEEVLHRGLAPGPPDDADSNDGDGNGNSLPPSPSPFRSV